MPSPKHHYDKNRFLRLCSSALLIAVVADCASGQAETQKVDALVKRWAPIVWLAPQEKFLPSSIEEFLQYVFPGDINGKPFHVSLNGEKRHLPVGQQSRSLYLHTKDNLDYLRNTTSFINGKDPKKYSVPIYAVITSCEIYNTSNHIDLPYFHVTYWIFHPYNEGKEVCFIGNIPAPLIYNVCIGKKKFMGNHVGDFEHLSMSFRGKPYPDELYISTHDAGAYYRYNPIRGVFKYVRDESKMRLVQRPKFPMLVRTSKGRPLLFSAYGSHGLWGAPGLHNFVRVPKLNDRTGYGIPWKTWFNVKTLHLGVSPPPVWIKYLGKWGNPKRNCLFSGLGLCEFSDGPDGILHRTQDFQCSR